MSTKTAAPRPKATPAKKAPPKKAPVRNTKPAAAKKAPITPAARKAIAALKPGESVEVELAATVTETPAEFLPDASLQPDMTVHLIAAMDHSARVAMARHERDSLSAWFADPQGDKPGTPVMDWMLDPTSIEQTRPRSSGRATVERDPEVTEAIKTAIVEARTAGKTWQGVCNELTKRNLPTARGGRWYYSTARAVAVQLGVVDTPTTAKD